ncbi:hypothetical protein WG922_18615 [Ramlibacter sp. AN1015]|uniref:hypothetical protein n=1 Tax=Ramlibacter sp. AN1015 TaxID=3133428 RepID=UPI0030C2B5FA
MRTPAATALACLLLSGSAAFAQVPTDPALVEAERVRIAQERAAAEARFAEESIACRARFAVNDCVAQSRARRRAVLSELRQQELALNASERQRRGAERLLELEQRKRDADDRAPDRTPSGAGAGAGDRSAPAASAGSQRTPVAPAVPPAMTAPTAPSRPSGAAGVPPLAGTPAGSTTGPTRRTERPAVSGAVPQRRDTEQPPTPAAVGRSARVIPSAPVDPLETEQARQEREARAREYEERLRDAAEHKAQVLQRLENRSKPRSDPLPVPP